MTTIVTAAKLRRDAQEFLRFERAMGIVCRRAEFDLDGFVDFVVLVNLCNLCPVLGRVNLTVIHDANPWLIPDNYSLPFRLAYYVLVPLSIRRSRAWVTVSEYSAAKLLARRIADRGMRTIHNCGV